MLERDDCDILAVTTTVGSPEQARDLARALVQARLAACVQVDESVHSVYHWEGKLCEDAEVRLTIKTLPERLPALQQFLAERHPYQLPQFLSWCQRASPGYAAWVRQALSRPSGSAAGADRRG